MAGPDPDADAIIAYYCFINLGWPPSQYDNLPEREKILVAQMAQKEMKAREAAQRK